MERGHFYSERQAKRLESRPDPDKRVVGRVSPERPYENSGAHEPTGPQPVHPPGPARGSRRGADARGVRRVPSLGSSAPRKSKAAVGLSRGERRGGPGAGFGLRRTK